MKFQNLFKKKVILLFHHIALKQLIAWWHKFNICTRKGEEIPEQVQTTEAPVLVNLCWWITISAFHKDEDSEKALSTTFCHTKEA